jgi:hypothetical protein
MRVEQTPGPMLAFIHDPRPNRVTPFGRVTPTAPHWPGSSQTPGTDGGQPRPAAGGDNEAAITD